MNDRDSELSCADFVRTLADYCDRSLSAIDLRRSEAHAAACPDCARYRRDYEATVRLLSATDDGGAEIPEDLVQAILATRSRTH